MIFRSRYPDLQPPEARDRAINARLPSSLSKLAEDAADEKDDLLTLAYAPSVRPELSLFDHVLGEPKRSFVPPLGPKDHPWAATPLPASAFAKNEQTCLANGIYFEARGEEEKGQAAVGQVILNRVRNPAYPDTICGVVYQNQNWKNRCQFSFACDGIEDRITDRRSYAAAEMIGHKVTNGEIWLQRVGSANNYHATYVSPRWAQAMERVDQIGLHIFIERLAAAGIEWRRSVQCINYSRLRGSSSTRAMQPSCCATVWVLITWLCVPSPTSASALRHPRLIVRLRQIYSMQYAEAGWLNSRKGSVT
ncbi:cell wall hydrolase [Aurantimonas coralicida]|uniref:cell wall hydrolase n=1 Tax=Aurantimonas coralicida TaxID=182270 RepID=UPI000686C5E9|nr:cell wall hydrolase [Aurantimonas coralicida]